MNNYHRGIPTASRANDLLDQLKQEFDTHEVRNRENEHTITQQLSEMEMIRTKVYQMEQSQQQIKMKYEEEITRLRRELEARGGPSQSHLSGVGGPLSQQPAPTIGHGPSNLFGNIMAGPGQAGPALAPPPIQDQQQQQAAQGQMPQPPPLHQGPPQQQYPGYNPPPVNGKLP
jgi:glucose repression regulatory protein TUP1